MFLRAYMFLGLLSGSSSTFILSSAASIITRTPPSVRHTSAPPTPPAAVKHCSSSSFSTFSTFKSLLFFSEHIFALSGPPSITLHFPASQSTLPSTCHMTPLSLLMLYSCFCEVTLNQTYYYSCVWEEAGENTRTRTVPCCH